MHIKMVPIPCVKIIPTTNSPTELPSIPPLGKVPRVFNYKDENVLYDIIDMVEQSITLPDHKSLVSILSPVEQLLTSTTKSQLAEYIITLLQCPSCCKLNVPHSIIIGGTPESKHALAVVLANILYSSGYISKQKVKIISCNDLIHQRIGYTGEITRRYLDKYNERVIFLKDTNIDNIAINEIFSAIDDYINNNGTNVIILDSKPGDHSVAGSFTWRFNL